MKKIILVFVLLFSFLSINASGSSAEEISYPFDSIKIISAFTFEVLIDQEPSEESILYGNVVLNETLTIYVGNLEFVYEGVLVEGSGSIIILTNENDEDFVAWLINSYSSNLTTEQSASFASWITIDPEVGVLKDLSGLNIEVGYHHSLLDDEFTFFDNLNVEYNMIDGTYIFEDSLDIIISAYVEVE